MNLSVGTSTKEKSRGKCRKLKERKRGRRSVATDAGLYPDSRGFKNTMMVVLCNVLRSSCSTNHPHGSQQ